ncbi:hypothetical protein PFLA_a2886 [Pseudoalteromonas flavipulchra NCIMB 2033 = ATCC BAA-314]|nr:hypothetical protein [Pseudoalteromonas flavipulchra NCIMB 2033 = ATCC BAA-314]
MDKPPPTILHFAYAVVRARLSREGDHFVDWEAFSVFDLDVCTQIVG